MGIPNSETIWQVEQDKFCQKVLRKHWPKAKIYNDVREISSDNVDPVDLLCGGFPCQDISLAGKGKGLDGEKSGLWWEMHRIIRSLRPRVVVLENVPAITIRGGLEVIGSLTELGYLCEWRIISARQFGAPHIRKRWFCVAYSDSKRLQEERAKQLSERYIKHGGLDPYATNSDSIRSLQTANGGTRQTCTDGMQIQPGRSQKFTDSDGSPLERTSIPRRIQKKKPLSDSSTSTGEGQKCYWQKTQAPSPICRVDDGVPDRLHRIRALGNAIVPQCSEYIGRLIHESGVLYG